MTTTDEWQKARDAGWKLHQAFETEDHETIVFTRPKQKPNAVVDFDRLMQAVSSVGYLYGYYDSGQGEGRLKIALDFLKSIKRVTP